MRRGIRIDRENHPLIQRERNEKRQSAVGVGGEQRLSASADAEISDVVHSNRPTDSEGRGDEA